jgi:N-glycosidase YbiA
MKEIKFYEAEDPYGYFSNFALYPLELNGKTWPTSEHYYQAQKVVGTEWEENIRLCATPLEAFEMTRLPEFPERADWVDVKDAAMYEAVYAKFTQHEDLQKKLLDSGDAVLIEDSPVDYYWGCGSEGTGKNMLGKTLMEIRKALFES